VAKLRRRKIRILNPLLISIPEFARMSGLGDSFVRELVAEGELPVRVIRGRKWIIRDRAIEWLCRQPAA
jgi:hypothetical protein